MCLAFSIHRLGRQSAERNFWGDNVWWPSKLINRLMGVAVFWEFLVKPCSYWYENVTQNKAVVKISCPFFSTEAVWHCRKSTLIHSSLSHHSISDEKYWHRNCITNKKPFFSTCHQGLSYYLFLKQNRGCSNWINKNFCSMKSINWRSCNSSNEFRSEPSENESYKSELKGQH